MCAKPAETSLSKHIMLWGYSNYLLVHKNDPKAQPLKTITIISIFHDSGSQQAQLADLAWCLSCSCRQLGPELLGLLELTSLSCSLVLSLFLSPFSLHGPSCLASGSRTFHIVAEEKVFQETRQKLYGFRNLVSAVT